MGFKINNTLFAILFIFVFSIFLIGFVFAEEFNDSSNESLNDSFNVVAEPWGDVVRIVADGSENHVIGDELSQEEGQVLQEMSLVEQNSVSSAVRKLQICINTTIFDETPIYETYYTNPCENITGACAFASKVLSHQIGIEQTPRVLSNCHTTGLLINDYIKLNLQEYACSTQEVAGSVIAICDSIYDGNHDGICQSGESCMKFVVNGTNVETYMKNSRDDFVTSDEKYFLPEVSVEVQ